MGSMAGLRVTVNGEPLSLAGTAPYISLLDLIRTHGLTGAKEGCAEGECGACSVLVARPRADGGPGSQWVAVNACLPPALAYAGQQVITAEGLGSPDRLHPVQAEVAQRGGSQCGYCTPGFVASMAAEYYRPDRAAAAGDPVGGAHGVQTGPNGFDPHALSGNLCRCTGYRPILDAAFALGTAGDDDPLAARRQEPPPDAPAVEVTAPGQRFVRPADLAQALAILAAHPEAVPLAGATDLGVSANLALARPSLLVAIDHLAELRGLQVGEDVVEIGAGLTLSEIEARLAGRVPLLAALFPQFASRLIRNAATLGGNLGTASPIGDAAPALLALDATLVLASVAGTREVPMADYFTGYRQTVRRPGELITAVRFPTAPASLTAFHKIAKRQFDDISSVAVAFALQIEGGTVVRARIGLGGVAATPLRAVATEAALTGHPWTQDTVDAAAAVLRTEGTPMSDHRASDRYRRAMLGTSLLRLFAQDADAPASAEVTR
jgi:xanthine dehydrogenase small subunit